MSRNSNLMTLQNDLNSQASCLNKWCKSNKLTINPQKCHILAISPKSNKNVTDFFIKLDGTVISAENSGKYLGINLDLNLNFCKHIEVIENKLSRSLAILFKLKPVLPQNALLKLYYAMVQGWNRSGFSRPGPTGKFQNHRRLTCIFTDGFCSLFNVSNEKILKGGAWMGC